MYSMLKILILSYAFHKEDINYNKLYFFNLVLNIIVENTLKIMTSFRINI